MFKRSLEVALTSADIERVHRAGKIAILASIEGGRLILDLRDAQIQTILDKPEHWPAKGSPEDEQVDALHIIVLADACH